MPSGGVPSPRRSASPFARLGRALYARPRAVALAFCVAALGAAAFGASVADRLQAGGLEVPGSESDRAAQRLAQRLGMGTPDVIAVLHSPDGDVREPSYASFVLDGLEQLFEDEAVLGAMSHYDTGLDALVSLDGRRTLLLVDLEGTQAERVAALKRVDPLLREIYPGVELGGPLPAEALAQEIAERDIRAAELAALPFAALLTLLFFRSGVAALLPIAMGGFALAVCSAVIRLVAGFTEVSIFALSVSAFLGLGLSIDYALLVVQRFREELAARGSSADTVAVTLDTAGRAVWVSGLTVLVSLLVLFVVPVPLLWSIALGGILAVASAVVGALFLLPALLAWLGPRVNLLPVGRAPGLAGPSLFWERVGRFAMRHPVLTAGSCSVLLVVLALPALRMEAVLPDARTLPRDSEIRRVEDRLGDPAQFDPSGVSAVQIVVETRGPALLPENLKHIQAYLTELRGVEGIREIQTPLADLGPDDVTAAGELRDPDPDLLTQLARTVDRDLALLTARGEHPWRSRAAGRAVAQIRALEHPELQVQVAGPTAMLLDVRRTLSSYGLVVAVLVVAWNLAVLFAAFRSVLVPLKAALMNLLSLAASFGVLVWVFQDGNLAGLLGFEPPGGIEPTVPLVLAAVVFGLSMDYEVFLLSRIQEEYLRDGDNERSIVAGLAHTGRIITSAALILLVVIGAFAAGQLIYVKEIGIGMAAAIALDVTLVRALLVPATMRLLGHYNWWAPRWLGGGARPAAAAAESAEEAELAPR
jgi:RND superfamily putative drug exporter